jgi:hypothetical protein
LFEFFGGGLPGFEVHYRYYSGLWLVTDPFLEVCLRLERAGAYHVDAFV